MNAIEILFENDEIRIINKPYNLATQGGKNIVNSVDTVLKAQTGEKIFLVHRLDKETAGILVTAKNPVAANRWSHLIDTKQVKKIYHALCFGLCKNKSGVIQDDIVIKGCAKKAATYFKVLGEFVGKNDGDFNFSLIEATLETGRMHQIRNHLAKYGVPIVGDDKYGDFAKNKRAYKTLGFKKMMLVSKRLEFSEKLCQELHCDEIEIPYPEHFSNSLAFILLV